MRDFLKKGDKKVNRKPTNDKIDAQIFRRTAASAKAINLAGRTYRGGTRL